MIHRRRILVINVINSVKHKICVYKVVSILRIINISTPAKIKFVATERLPVNKSLTTQFNDTSLVLSFNMFLIISCALCLAVCRIRIVQCITTMVISPTCLGEAWKFLTVGRRKHAVKQW